MLTVRLEDSDTGVAVVGDGVVADNGGVAAAVEHDTSVSVVVHHVVLDRNVVAPLGRDDTVVSCNRKTDREHNIAQGRVAILPQSYPTDQTTDDKHKGNKDYPHDRSRTSPSH